MTINGMSAAAWWLGAIAASAVAASTGAVPTAQNPTSTTNVNWAIQRGDSGGTQYSALAQIHAANVHELQPAWVYHTGDATARSNMHVNPIVIDGVMYVTTPSLKTVALDASTGRERWTFDPARYNERNAVIRLRNRGVTYWKGAGGERIFDFVKDRVYALNAESGSSSRRSAGAATSICGKTSASIRRPCRSR